MDSINSNNKEMLSMESKIIFLGSKRDVDDIIEAVTKVAKNIDKLT
jgi:hypothetical protein